VKGREKREEEKEGKERRKNEKAGQPLGRKDDFLTFSVQKDPKYFPFSRGGAVTIRETRMRPSAHSLSSSVVPAANAWASAATGRWK
jgi:hypothetical protein